jgi:hypothetical protein
VPARGSCLETLLTTLVGSAAVIVWVNELLDDGWLGVVGIVIVALVALWVFNQRTRMDDPPERPFLIGGAVALLLGIAFQIGSNYA